MKVLLYTEGEKMTSNSGLGKAIKHQMKALKSANVEYTTNLKDDYDIIHINCYNAFGLIYGKILKRYTKKIIIHAHNSELNKDILYIKKMINYIIKLFFRDKKFTYIAVSKSSSLFCFGNTNSLLIPNGVNYKDYIYKEDEKIKYRKKYNIDSKKIVIENIGRMEAQKNQFFLIDIFNELLKLNDNYFLVLVGEGKLYKKIKNKINKLSLNEKVLIFKYRNDINKFINMFDIYLFPSLFEGFGITLIENQINNKIVFTSLGITNEIKISNNIYFLPLNKSSKFWADK